MSSPGMSAIKAVLNPEKTEYLYFVAEKDGHHRFTKTYAEHLKAIEDIHGPQ
ncbi:endolytic transglycosylase MltG [Phascolarctobacterium faecium]|uniref:endolytic transglycosylase MltG n=1 Tax=Phascolarctobacterium faecium TaxID=33025 RepID=UPI00307F32C1